MRNFLREGNPLEHQRESSCLRYCNGVSIVIVTYNSEQTVGACLYSVSRTMGNDDQVIVIDNASKDRTCQIVGDFIAGKNCFKLIPNTVNRGYAAAANQGSGAGDRPYIVFLNPDTIVTPYWQKKLQFHLQPHKRAAVGPVSDYVAGLQKAAYYLPKEFQYNGDVNSLLENLYRHNQKQSCPTPLLIGFCLMVKRSIFETIGGMDDNLFLGNDDLDLSWRLRSAGYELAVAKDTMVFHKGQASFQSESKQFTDALVQESTDFLYHKLFAHYGPAQIPTSKALWGMDWFRPTCRFQVNQPLTSIIILTYNQINYTRQCVNSVFENTFSPFELICVDNGSSDGTQEYLTSLDRSQSACIRIKTILNKANLGFARGNNQGLAEARGTYVLLLNNDVVVTPNWLERLLEHAENNPRLGLAGPMTNHVSGPQRVQKPDYDLHTLAGLEGFVHRFGQESQGKSIPCWRIAGFCMLIKRAVIEKIGGLDPRYGLGNFEDDDFCLRSHLAGFEAVIVKDSYVHHYGGQTFKGNDIDYNENLHQNWKLFKLKWNIDINTPLRSQYSVMVSNGEYAKKHYVAIGQPANFVP